MKPHRLFLVDRPVVSGADRSGVFNSVTGVAIEGLDSVGERDYLVSKRRGRVRAVSYRDVQRLGVVRQTFPIGNLFRPRSEFGVFRN